MMVNNTDLQRAHFGRIRHDVRFEWQTQDPFVLEREHATIYPLAETILVMAKQCNKPIRILESGCGQGVNMIHLRQMGVVGDQFALSGIDFTPEAIEEAKKHGLDVQVANGLALPFEDESFDIVFTRDVLHHLANDDERKTFVTEMKRVAKPGGIVVAVEPNPWNPMLFGFSVVVSAERGIQDISEPHLSRLLPGATVVRTCPSAAWRGWYHYCSPFRSIRFLAPLTRFCLRQWEKVCQRLPTSLWAWRVYRWNR